MNIASFTGVIGSAAGVPLAQTKGAETERAGQDSANQQRRVESDAKADLAAGVGATGEDSAADPDRDADGRLPWQLAAKTAADVNDSTADAYELRSRDPDGAVGNELDLSG